MHPSTDDILTTLKDKYQEHNISRYELERIIDTEWKYLEQNITDRSDRIVHLIYLGKVVPTKLYYNLKNAGKLLNREEYAIAKKAYRDTLRNKKQAIQTQEDTNTSGEEKSNL